MPTTLSAGDIAITAAQADNAGGGANGDFFEFVLLVPVTTGTTIFFTDSGFRTDASVFRTNEQVLRWVAQADLAAGTVVSFTAPAGNAVANTPEWTGITATTGAVAANALIQLAGGGDSISAIQNPTFGGTDALTGTYLAQLNFGGATFNANHTAASGNATTGLATGLTDGVNAISIGPNDNVRYNGTTVSGTQAELRTALNTDSSWQGLNTPFTVQGSGATFTLNAQNGTAGADTLSGGNDINGLGGDDIISGGSGNQTLDGGEGTDTVTYASSTVGVIVSLNRNTANDGRGGTDTLNNFENAIGSDFADIINGLEGAASVLNGGLGADVLIGKDGNDTLIGGSGAANEIYGGAGDDTYVVSANDTLVEAADAGTDTVQTTLAAHTLRANFENLTYTGASSFIGRGNDLANVITGGVAADTLSGGGGNDTLVGGSGAANTLIGGTGDDTYTVTVRDTIVEASGEGTDTVNTTLTYFGLTANVENLTFTGTGNFAGIGNAAANVITGGAGLDTLTGGAGNDSLIGGDGRDTAQFSGAASDYLIENLGGGIYRVTDSVGGRDGVDTLTTMEQARFSDSTVILSTIQPNPFPTLSEKDAGALVLPSLADDEFVFKGANQPLVLPNDSDRIDEVELADFDGAALLIRPGFMVTLADTTTIDDMSLFHDNGRDHWLF